MRDSISNLQCKRGVSPLTGTDNTAFVSQIIDTQGYDSLAFVILTGTLADADATFTTLMEESDAVTFGGEENAVADADMVKQDPSSSTAPEAQASFAFGDDDEVRKIGYIGSKRYVRLTITPANNTGSAPVAAVAILGNAGQKPVIQASA